MYVYMNICVYFAVLCKNDSLYMQALIFAEQQN